MNQKPLMAVAVIVLMLAAASTRAADSDATTQPSDKSQYTLFNPTPANQMRELDTDRPDKTDTPRTADAGHLILETGIFDYTYNRDRLHGDNARTDDFSFGQFNFRLGVLDNLELNAVINSVDISRETDYIANDSERQASFGDTVLGGKINLWGNDIGDTPWQTALGFKPQFKIPTAREDIGNGHPEGNFGFPFLLNLPAEFALYLETAVDWTRNADNTGYTTGWENSFSLDRQIVGNLDGFVEVWSDVTSEHHQEAQATLDLGLTYSLNENVALDTSFDFGLNHASDSFEWLSGISVRF